MSVSVAGRTRGNLLALEQGEAQGHSRKSQWVVRRMKQWCLEGLWASMKKDHKDEVRQMSVGIRIPDPALGQADKEDNLPKFLPSLEFSEALNK